jgi:hypothetical protein
MSTDRIGGITYTFANVGAFLANRACYVQYLGDRQRAEPVQQPRDGSASRLAGVLHRLRAGRVAVLAEADPQLRAALRLLHAAPRGERPDRQVQHRHRGDRPAVDAAVRVEKEQLRAARVAHLCTRAHRVRRRRRRVRRPGSDRGPDSARLKRSRQLDDQQHDVLGRPGGARRQPREQPEQPLY